jgi:hypothetical protein
MGTRTWSVVSGGGSINSSGLYTPPYGVGSATIQAAVGTATGKTTVTFSGQAQWYSSTDGSWNANGIWEDSSSEAVIASPPGLRGIPGDTVLFSSATGNLARLDGASPSIAAITFNNSSKNYTISQGSGGVLHFADRGNNATVTISSGKHAISAPVALDSSVVILPAAGSQLNISGGISGADQRQR